MSRLTAPSLKDVAQHAGVSVATVSRVINDGPYVTEALRARVTASMTAVGYVPHALAKSLRTGQTLTVGYVVGDIANPLFATIARGIDDELQRSAYTMFLGNSRGEARHELQLIQHMLRRRVDGLILSLADETEEALQAYLGGLSIPLVLLDRELAGVQADRVLVDHVGGVTAAVSHLAELGHRRIALITGRPTTRPGLAIRAGFDKAVASLGLAVAPGHIRVGTFDDAFGAAALGALLDEPGPPTAVIAGGAQITPGVLRAARARGLRIPEDLSLVAYDDTDVTALYAPAITVVARDVYAIGAQAARLLIDRLTGSPDPTRRRIVGIPTSLVIRGSTAPPSTETV
jgi:LacI family transcriptional regulator